uniref:PH domain-containing protein n=1 Tax=Cercocebus atys TaxID=9531 RepID=A0A2K5MFF2_CERAT
MCFFKRGTILKRWKKNWFDLWSDGHLIYYDDQTRQNIEDKVHMPVDCINIRTGQECRGELCMSQVVWGKSTLFLFSRAWKFTLQDSRTNTAYVGLCSLTDTRPLIVTVPSPPPYTAYAAPAPEVGRTLSLQVREAWDLCCCPPRAWP